MTSVKGFLADRWHEGWPQLHRVEGQVKYIGPLPFRCSCQQALHPDAPHQSKNGLVKSPSLSQAVFRSIAQTHTTIMVIPSQLGICTIAVVHHPAKTSPDSVERAAPEDTHHEFSIVRSQGQRVVQASRDEFGFSIATVDSPPFLILRCVQKHW